MRKYYGKKIIPIKFMEFPDEINGYKTYPNGILVHHVVVERREDLITGWHIHHCDGDKRNNNYSNLVQVPRQLHALIHKLQKGGRRYPSKLEIITLLVNKFGTKYLKYNKKPINPFKTV